MNINHDTPFNKHFDDLLRYFGISISEDNKRLPSIYRLPKLHKNRTKAKFVVTVSICSVKPLPNYITIKKTLIKTNLHNFQVLIAFGLP